jgi:hypothetical protein
MSKLSGWAYYDEAGILRVVDHLGVAVDNCKRGIVVETDIEAQGGYPRVNGDQIIYDSSVAKCYKLVDNNRELIDTPEQVENLIHKIFMKEYTIASEE